MPELGLRSPTWWTTTRPLQLLKPPHLPQPNPLLLPSRPKCTRAARQQKTRWLLVSKSRSRFARLRLQRLLLLPCMAPALCLFERGQHDVSVCLYDTCLLNP
ncbi:hypothetical protein BCR44DRAFT_1444392 [Catenaria anguillulae PL171]|uniref:Uncharacterized protein n=1 Tax=Catenaria anguillulae PL171 TaxID=765915 RepID=A0A1Y2HA71_9FUNG|nr:hypothetical protein BCR44DRAFT_1444392 [Catenaria anguillulae PL171]